MKIEHTYIRDTKDEREKDITNILQPELTEEIAFEKFMEETEEQFQYERDIASGAYDMEIDM